MSNTIKVGDIVGMIYAQPGNDVTFLLVEKIHDDKADCWDLGFQMMVDDVKLAKLWKASEKECAMTIGHYDRNLNGKTYQQIADIRRAHNSSNYE